MCGAVQLSSYTCDLLWQQPCHSTHCTHATGAKALHFFICEWLVSKMWIGELECNGNASCRIKPIFYTYTQGVGMWNVAPIQSNAWAEMFIYLICRMWRHPVLVAWMSPVRRKSQRRNRKWGIIWQTKTENSFRTSEWNWKCRENRLVRHACHDLLHFVNTLIWNMSILNITGYEAFWWGLLNS